MFYQSFIYTCLTWENAGFKSFFEEEEEEEEKEEEEEPEHGQNTQFSSLQYKLACGYNHPVRGKWKRLSHWSKQWKPYMLRQRGICI